MGSPHRVQVGWPSFAGCCQSQPTARQIKRLRRCFHVFFIAILVIPIFPSAIERAFGDRPSIARPSDRSDTILLPPPSPPIERVLPERRLLWDRRPRARRAEDYSWCASQIEKLSDLAQRFDDLWVSDREVALLRVPVASPTEFTIRISLDRNCIFVRVAHLTRHVVNKLECRPGDLPLTL